MNYEVKIRHNAPQPGGFLKSVTSQFLLLDCLSFTEAEARATKYFKDYYEQFDVTDIKRSKIGEVVERRIDDETADKYYLCKLSLICIDEKLTAEKRIQYQYLVNASSVNAANETIVEYMRSSMADYEIDDILTTKFVDVVLPMLGE